MEVTEAVETEKAYILVIDDDPLLTRTLKKALETENYFVDTASNGYEGIKKAKSGFFHLILCDLRMPGLDGLMTIRHIQDFQKKTGVGNSGFVVITAYGNDDNRRQAFQLGVTDFMSKPFDLSNFLETIRHSVKPLVRQTPQAEVERLNRKLDQLLSTFPTEEPEA